MCCSTTLGLGHHASKRYSKMAEMTNSGEWKGFELGDRMRRVVDNGGDYGRKRIYCRDGRSRVNQCELEIALRKKEKVGDLCHCVTVCGEVLVYLTHVLPFFHPVPASLSFSSFFSSSSCPLTRAWCG